MNKQTKNSRPLKIIDADSDNQEFSTIIDTDYMLVTMEEMKSKRYNIYLGDSVQEPAKYYSIFNILRTTTSLDNVVFYINNYGGQLNTTAELIHAIRASQATTHAVVTGPIYSAAPIITLAAKKIYLEKHIFMMFHDYSGLEHGKGNEMEKSIKAYQPYFKALISDVCRPFLTQKEIRSILEGKDLYLDYEECKKRLESIKKLED